MEKNKDEVSPPVCQTFEELVEVAAALYPKLDRWVIEGYVKCYFDGLLTEKGALKMDE